VQPVGESVRPCERLILLKHIVDLDDDTSDARLSVRQCRVIELSRVRAVVDDQQQQSDRPPPKNIDSH
jgi:hypothetical protein